MIPVHAEAARSTKSAMGLRSDLVNHMILAILSAFLLIGSFPHFNFSFLAWIAFLPFFFLIKNKTPRSAFFWGWGVGYLFFLGTHYWLIHVTLPGMLLVNLYLAVYFGCFAILARVFLSFPQWGQMILLPSAWVLVELARDRIMTGFGWACLGHSQYTVLPLIQIADLTGVFGVSFIVMMVNVVLYQAVDNWADRKSVPFKNFVICFLIIGLVLLYGGIQIQRYLLPRQLPGDPSKVLNIGVVQPNIPQSQKWQSQSLKSIQEKLLHLSLELLVRNSVPVQFVVWPETSVPGYMWLQPEYFEGVKAFCRRYSVPMLVGAVTEQQGFYNSALLVSQEGEVVGQYDKKHLVPFGEFLPLRPLLNFVEHFVPIGDFNRGRRFTVFPGEFSVLICFEDTVAQMVRDMTRAGARYLINISNDGWFKDTNEPYLHLQNAVLQSVANRRVMIRCGNTGISSKVDRIGQVVRLKDSRGKSVMIEGAAVFSLAQAELESTLTGYTRFGDIFAYLCLLVCAGGIIIRKKYCS